MNGFDASEILNLHVEAQVIFWHNGSRATNAAKKCSSRICIPPAAKAAVI
jgi:hypothetical protein